MESLVEYLVFLAKVATIVVAALILVSGVVGAMRRSRPDQPHRVRVENLNKRFDALRGTMERALHDKRVRRRLARARKRAARGRRARPRVFVLEFHGDLRASAVESLRDEVTAVLSVARPEDEVVMRLESPGGLVPAYGLAASQLLRVREREIPLTVAVDKVAASGGYLMAAVANRIVAAPFAILGSIGVVGQLPNFHRLLKRHDVDFELHTAGEFKRTLTLFGPNDDRARDKFRQDLEETHQLFKAFVAEHRPVLDVDAVATGEYWYGTRARELSLADEIRTSDDYLLARSEDADVFRVRSERRRGMSERLAGGAATLIERLRDLLWRSERDSRLG